MATVKTLRTLTLGAFGCYVRSLGKATMWKDWIERPKGLEEERKEVEVRDRGRQIGSEGERQGC